MSLEEVVVRPGAGIFHVKGKEAATRRDTVLSEGRSAGRVMGVPA